MSRMLSISNSTTQTLGAMGTTFQPGQTKSVSAGELLNDPAKVQSLITQVAAGRLIVHMGGDTLSVADLANLEAPIDAGLYLKQEFFENPAAADPNGIKTAFLAPAVATTYSGTGLTGVVGGARMATARNITITGTTGGGEALIVKDIVINGLDVDGNTLSETITTTILGAGASVTDYGVKAFSKIISIEVPLDTSPAAGDYEIGFGDVFGLTSPLTRGGMISEFVDNTAVGAAVGTVVLSGTSGPNGTYQPDATLVANGARDYVLTYVANQS